MEKTIKERKGYSFLPAGPEDNELIKSMYESVVYDGPIDVQFRRGEHPYDSIMNEGEDGIVMICRSEGTGEAVAMGACCIHEMYVDGEIKRVGYLNGLKILPQYQRHNTVLPRAFAAMGKVLEGRVDLCIASMLKTAVENQKMFEKRRKSMPAYVRQCQYTTFFMKPAGSRESMNLERGYASDVEEFYRENLIRYNLSKVGRIRGIQPEDYVVWRKDGRVIAACALHNEQSYKGYFLNRYNGYMRAVSKLPTKRFGYPPFPKEGTMINAMVMSCLLFNDSVSLNDRRRFIKGASSFAVGYDAIMVGLTDTDSSYKIFNRIRHIKFPSYLYTIEWGEDHSITSRPVMCDAALM